MTLILTRPSEIASDARILAPFLPLTVAYLVVLTATRGVGTMAPKPSGKPLTMVAS
jgi:hypothetical protein